MGVGFPPPMPLFVGIQLATNVVAGSVIVANPGTSEERENIQTALIAINQPPPLYFSEWLFDYFAAAELSNSAVSDLFADPDGKLQVEYENNETGSRNIVSYLFLSVLYVAYIITFNLQIYNKDYTVSTYLLQIFFWQNSISIRDCMIT